MKLISREEAIKRIQKVEQEPNYQHDYEGWRDGLIIAENIVDELPTVEERKEGSWIPVDSYSAYGGVEEIWEAQGNPIAFHYCSECKEQANANEFGEELLTDYCPYCGAYMKGE